MILMKPFGLFVFIVSCQMSAQGSWLWVSFSFNHYFLCQSPYLQRLLIAKPLQEEAALSVLSKV